MKLFVYHTPEELPAHSTSQPAADCAIVIDVLRATTTIVTALNVGAESVQAFSDLDALQKASEQVPADKRLRAGERGGQQVAGCDLGNSPLDHTPERTAGRKLFMSTTNGTRCLESVQDVPTVIVAALLNREAVVDYLVAKNPNTVWLVGSGWEGSYSLEDTVCAGAIADGLLCQLKKPLHRLAGNDELIAAVSLYRQWQGQLLELLTVASHGQRLLGLQKQKDLEYCAQLDTLDILPMQTQQGVFSQR